MGLKKISSRHLDIIRRLIVGQTMQEICIDLGLSLSRVSMLKADPLFASAYYEMENKVTEGFIETRASAMEILENAAPEAARLTRDAIIGEQISGEDAPQGLRLKSAWDCLDRTGNKAVDKHLVGHVDLAELIGKAYQEKHGGSSGPQQVDEKPPAPNANASEFHNPGDAVQDGIVREVDSGENGNGNGNGNGTGENAKELESSASQQMSTSSTPGESHAPHPNDCANRDKDHA